MTTLEPDIDPSLAALADAVLIPPFYGTTPPDWILDALGRGLAGVTLFGNNVTGDISQLTTSLRTAASAEPVIAIDEEGGDVTRVDYAEGSPYPGNAALGVVDDVEMTREVYAAMGADLRRLGINTNLAPCADVLAAGGSPVIGTRSFGADPKLVARHVAAAVEGLQKAGVAACAKHFPGHGSTSADSHRVLATISGSLEEIRRRDLPPFEAAIAAGTWSLMPGHLRVPELTGDLPATLSAAAVTGLLRGELGFSGTVICDALEMKAASAIFGIPEAAVLAVIAGVDLLCLGRDTDEEMYHAIRTALAEAVTSGRLAASRLEEAASRVASLRARLGEARRDGEEPGGWAGPATDGIGLIAARRALYGSGPIPARLSDPLIIEVEPEENIAAGRFTWGFSHWSAVRRIDPADASGSGLDGAALSEILYAAAGRSLVLAVRDATGALPLVTGLLSARPDMIIVEMGVPTWNPPEGTAYLATYGASRACAMAAAEALGLA
ncbi:MAG TPA: glycoside hydrolase family 3 N-terminal domain-containing protein [Trebonia sp.]|nr:glycoside hydrolase family 3 N-terminal domain-containing protein [Trebonia sp.]